MRKMISYFVSVGSFVLLWCFCARFSYPLVQPGRNAPAAVLMAFSALALLHIGILFVNLCFIRAFSPNKRRLLYWSVFAAIIGIRGVTTLYEMSASAPLSATIQAVFTALPLILMFHGVIHLLCGGFAYCRKRRHNRANSIN